MKTIKAVIKWILIAFVGIIVLGLIFGKDEPASTPTKEPQSTPEPPPELFQTTAAEMAKLYDQNTVAADAKYKDQVFKVTGSITDINTDMFGNAVILLKGGVNQFMEPQFVLNDEHKNAAATLSKGQKVTLICTGKGDVAKTPMSDNCSITP